MELEFLGALQNLQLWLVLFAVGLPVTWLAGKLYGAWRRANLPAWLAKQKQQKRRDAVIKKTRERTTALEADFEALAVRIFQLEMYRLKTEERLSKLESKMSQLRQKLRSRGILFDG